MRALIRQTLVLHFTSHPFPLRRPFNSAAGDDPYRRRAEPYGPSPSPLRRNYDEENRSVKVTVWWDFENCQVPVGVNVERVANRITSALRSNGIKGPIIITAFGDVAQMSRATQEALTSTGVSLNHVPHRGKNSSDRSFMADLVYYVTQNPPPAHFFLISSDKDFANILHRLRMSNYNILLASNDFATGALCSAATVMWPWIELVKGENVPAKHFNHPPDGYYGSWYGQYKGALDDPFFSSEQCAVSQAEESMESISKTKIRPIPRVVVNGIRNVLHSYPKGMFISELRVELSKKNIAFDKDLYGHKKFSKLLASMPSIVKFIPTRYGQPLVADKRLVESAETTSKTSSDSIDLRSKNAKEAQTSKVVKNRTLAQDEKPLPGAPPDTVDVKTDTPTPMREDVKSAVPTPIHLHDAVENQLETAESTTTEQGHDAEVKEGFFKRIWMTLTGRRSDHPTSSVNSDTMSKVDSISTGETIKGRDSKNLESKEKAALPADSTSSSSNAFGTNKSVPEEKTSAQSEKHNEISNIKVGFFNRLANWWQPRRSGAKDQGQRFESVGKILEADGNEGHIEEPVICHQETHALFSRSHFWDALESFLFTSKGADLIVKSKTRDEVVHKLQNEGPSILKDLKESHIVKLVELLISEKKWIEESTSQAFPFKLKLPAEQRSLLSNAQHNGLSSLFPGSTSSVSERSNAPQNLAELKAWFQKSCNGTEDMKPEEFQRLFESMFNKTLVCSSYGYPTIRSLLFACVADNNNLNQVRKRKVPNRGEVLSDCHKLGMKLLKDNPEGFNMSTFRPAFFQTYGYILDCQTLGYSKLVSLLQIMPGVKIEPPYVLPDSMLSSGSSQVTTKAAADGLDGESPSNGDDWEELGPVSDDNSQTVGKQMGYSKVSLSDEEFTDSDDEIPSGFDEPRKLEHPKRAEEASSLLKILDSWYSGKEGGGGTDQDHAADGLGDCSRSNPQNTSDLTLADYPNGRVRSQKRYSFVADSGDANDKPDDVLSILKKAGERRLQS